MKARLQADDLATGDMTPMIDLVFQLIAFFVLVTNFSATEMNERVVLPKSVLVKPPEGALEFPITLHIADSGEIVMGGETFTLQTLGIGLNREITVLRSLKKNPADANVIIRAHRNAAAGDVQEVIRVAQEAHLERFALRVREDLGE